MVPYHDGPSRRQRPAERRLKFLAPSLRKNTIMNATFARLFSSVVLPAALLTGAIGCHQGGAAKIAAAAAPEPELTLIYGAPLIPKDRSDLAVYTARVDGESRTEIFVQGKSGEAPRLVHVDSEPGELVGVSDDGTRGVFHRFIAPNTSQDVTIGLQKSES